MIYMKPMKSITKSSRTKLYDFVKGAEDKAEKSNPILATLDKLENDKSQQIYGYIITFSSNQ